MKKCSIMLVDDSESDRYLLKRMIGKLEIATEIFEADNGQIALDFLTNYEENSRKYSGDFPPIVIFLDINMPIMGGFEFLEEFSILRENGNDYSSSVFTMFTSSERDEDKQKAQSYDFVKGFVVKGSMSVESLQEVIEKCLSHS